MSRIHCKAGVAGIRGESVVPYTPQEEAARDAEEAAFAAQRIVLEQASRNQRLIDLEQKRAAAERLGLTGEEAGFAAEIAALRGA